MGIKDLFGKTSNKVVSKAQIDKLADEVESYDLIDANADKNNKLIPRIDYSEAQNFAHYGSAEKYYEDSINYILKSYPYDGSEAEKLSWRNKASGLDEYILDHSFPKTAGHVKLNTSVSTDSTYAEGGAVGTWKRYTAPQYITIVGGPNKDPSANEGDAYELSKQFPPKGGKANIWDDELFRESNLGINPAYGNTVEFWMKSGAAIPASQAVCLFDLWNGVAHADAAYTRLTVTLPSSDPSSRANPHFFVTYKYGNAAEGVERAALTISAEALATMGNSWQEAWHHYAFAISNTDSGIKVDLYIDGVYDATVTAGNKITSTISQEAFKANINALRTKPLAGSPAGLAEGDGGAPSGLYLDEFRFWKKTRNAKQIGRYWFTPVYGGTNTDNTKYDAEQGDMVDLGVYYKFNEGIFDATTANTTDAQCLDYSGRISNGTIVNYSTAVRVATSAMDESTKVIAMGVVEEKDPVMYSTHADVQSLKTGLMLSGSMWDMQNNASMYHTMPGWILEEDEDGQVIKTLVQTLSSYFDTLHSQISMLGEIRDSRYFDLEDSQTKPVFFAKQLLRSVGFDVVDIFTEASILEEIVSRGEQEMYDNRIQDIKNVIYQNIYNNISYIYKTKGTEKSFRNLIRCFGVDDEIVKLNLYADGVDYTLEGRRSYSSIKKNYIDFNHIDRIDGCAYSKDVYGSSSDERAYIASPDVDYATATLTTDSASALTGKTLILTNYDGTTHTITCTTGAGSTNKDRINIDVVGNANDLATQLQASLSAAATAGDIDMTVSAVTNTTDGSGVPRVVTLTQKTAGDTGNTAISGTLISGNKVICNNTEAGGSHGTQAFTGGDWKNAKLLSTTLTAEVIFPLQLEKDHPSFAYKDFTTISLFGCKEANLAGDTWDDAGLSNIGRLQVQAIMGDDDSGTPTRDTTSAKFKLIYTDADGDHELVSDEIKDVWENSKWNFAVRIYPENAPLGDYVSGSGATKYNIDFYGIQISLDTVQNVFTKTAAFNGATAVTKARAMVASPKICYIGHYRDNFAVNTGILKTDVKVTDLMYWFDKLEDAEIQIHGSDVTNTGRQYPNDDAYQYFQKLSDGTTADIRVPKKDTLALHWNFANVLQSDGSGQFIVDDVSLGGASYIAESRYGWFTDLVGYRHTALAEFDAASCANDTQVINREYAYTAIHRLPEVLSGDDMVEIRTQDDDTFGKHSKPINHFWAIEKSMYQVISQEMLSLFASVVEFNDLIGQPVHRYRMEYKTLQKFRSLFYERVDNVPSFERFVAFYKWLDSSLGLMLQQLIPASGNFSDSMRNLVENHLLERSKYWTKFPTLEMKQDPPEGTLRGIRELTYDWEHGHAPIGSTAASATLMADSGGGLTGLTVILKNADGTSHTITGAALGAGNPSTATQFNVDEIGNASNFATELKESLDAAAAAGNIKMSVSAITNNTSGDPRVITLAQTTTGFTGHTLITGTLLTSNKVLINNTDAVAGGHGTQAFTGGGWDSPDHCLWWSERADRTWDGFLTPSAIDTDREKIRKAIVRDVLGQNKMVKVDTGGYVEEGDPTLYDIATSKQYEGSTYATRRLSRPYKLNLEQSTIITGGPNFANATPASPNDMIRSSTRRGYNIEITSLEDDAEVCRDEYLILDGPKKEKRRAHIVTLVDSIASVETPLKGSLITHPRYGTYPNDASPEWRSVHHDSYGQDHEVPMQGMFAAEWVGGNQHRHVDLNKGVDVVTNRAELYKVTAGVLQHPHDVNADHPAARWTRDGTAKRSFNIANINTAVNEDNYTTYTGTPKLGNYTRDYEVVQTSGRSQNNRWHVKNPAYTPDSIASTYVSGLYDFSLPDRTKNSAGDSFGRTEHVFVERFSAPGEPSTLSRGALDIQAEEYSAYNSMNFRNLRVRNHLNFWHKEHAAQFGYREDYIHGTESDAIGGVSNDFGGNTANVGSWHKNNRNPLTRMHLQQPNVESRRRYDNFYVSHQIPQSDWQYHWITSSAVHFNITGQPALQEYDDEERAAYTPTTFPWANISKTIATGAAGVTVGTATTFNTTTDHGFSTGDYVTLAVSGTGWVNLNDTTHLITVVDNNSFSIPFNSSTYTASNLQAGGTVVPDKLIFNPRLSGYITDYPNATIGVSGSLDWILTGAGVGLEVTSPGLLSSGSLGIAYTNTDGTAGSTVVDIDFVYGNYAVVDEVDWVNNLVGTTCPVCTLNRPIAEFGGDSANQKPAAGYSGLNALLLNRNGPYQGAGWKMLQHAYSPIVRQQRKRNVVTIQSIPDSNKIYEDVATATTGGIKLTVLSVPSANATITFDGILIPDSSDASEDTVTIDISNSPTVADVANMIADGITRLDRLYNQWTNDDDTSKIVAETSESSSVVYIRTTEAGVTANLRKITATLAAADVTVDENGEMTVASAFFFEKTDGTPTNRNPIKTEDGGLAIVADGGNKVVTVNFQDAEDEKIRTCNYNDRRSDSHDKYIEPPATWNKPMMHILSEKSDNVGLTAVHSYSNNLKTFANPKLSYRTGFETKTTAQNYDVLYDKYSPTTATQPTLDFVGLYYKEYIFPKNRNVGLLKTRSRASWDDVTDWTKQYSPTGDLRIFWKDNCFERIKGPRNGTVNALNSPAPQPPPYLLTEGGSGSLDNWNQVRSIFAMDNFVFDAPHPSDASTTVEWKAKGDLQYVGWETYMSWIVNRSCQYVSSTDWVNYNDVDIADLANNQNVWNTGAGTYYWDNQYGALDTSTYIPENAAAELVSRNGQNQQNAHGSTAPAPHQFGALQQAQTSGVSNARLQYQQTLLEFNNSGQSPTRIGDTEMVVTLTGSMGETPEMVQAGASVQLASPSTAATATRADMLPRCSPPEVVAQLYYNPHGVDYKEGAWLYQTNSLRGKNPWYNKYVDFSLETRCMAQNYGVVAEFRISEHMEKYLMVDGGDFRTKNFNFLSLHGASYNTVAPHYATTETAWSGKVTFPYEKVHSIDGTMANIVSEYPHSDEIYSGWQNLSIEAAGDDSQTAYEYLQNRIKTMNIAFSTEEGRGTFNSPTAYTDYSFQNPIHAGGGMSIGNSTIAGITAFGTIGVNSSVMSSTPWDGRPSWGQGNEDDGTGRHRWFAAKEDLSEDEIGYKGTDDDADGYGYDDPNLAATTDGAADTTLPPVYREGNSFSDWKAVLPFSHDANDTNPSVTSLKFNLNGATDEYMHGQITLWDKYTTSTANDTDIYGVAPFAPMTEQTKYDTLRVPSDAAAGQLAQARKELYSSAVDTTQGTPMTVSVWVKPELTTCTPDHARYDGNPVGLYVFGQYEFDGNGVSDDNQKKPRHWRRDLLSADGRFALFSNFPAPNSLLGKYSTGMGLTFVINKEGKDIGPHELGSKCRRASGGGYDDDVSGEDIYHFFRRDQRPCEGRSEDPCSSADDNWMPATLLEGEWSNVALQILPAEGSKNPKIKLTLTDRLTRPKGNESDNVLYEQVLYGIHRSALTNGSYKKRAYSTVPVGKSAAWGATYGNVEPTKFGEALGGYCYDYKLGKGIFADKFDDLALRHRRTRNLKRGGKERYWYFHGEMAEFSMWAGVLSAEDIDWIRQEPRNLLEGYLNGEVLGGYTNATNFNNYWGSGSPSEILSDNLINSTGGSNVGYTQAGVTISSEASRSTCKLTTWHRLGIKPTINITESCEDWDDEFFNSYVHTDTIQFFDAIVEDHDAVSDTLRRRLRFKVNALKKLIPYRGFYPQDRTLQLANLFAQKMTDSITGADESVLRREQAMQAAMQPFFAPGILYNSIKAGVAVDWPAFTNATGLEPVYPNSQCSLPYYNEDVQGLSDDDEMHTNGPEVRLSSIAPNWYNPRANPSSSTEGLLLEYEGFKSSDDVSADEIESQQHNELERLYNNQPKFFQCMGDSDWSDCPESANGYIIRQEPNMRIPFEGLVSIDSVLPKASDTYESLQDTIDEGDFKYVDLEISGWDCEGVEITLTQPIAKLADRHNPDTYPDGDEWTDNFSMTSVSITIGDDDREMSGDEWDVAVNFQRPPKGFKLPSFDQDGTSEDAEAGAWNHGEAQISLDAMNEEIAVKLCHHINSRHDIHYVAVPGALRKWAYGTAFDWEESGGGTTNDYVALNFPACYPEVFDIDRADIAPHADAQDAGTYDGAYTMNLLGNPDLWRTNGSKSPPPVGKQHNGTWRIRLVYVGPPKIKLDLKNVETAHTSIASGNNRFNVEADQIKELGMRPYNGIGYTAPDDGTIKDYTWERSDDYSTEYDSSDSYHYNSVKAGESGFINSQMRCASPANIDLDATYTDDPNLRIFNDGIGDGAKLNWKTLHLINPFRVSGGDGTYEGFALDSDSFDSGTNLPSTWLRKGSIEPYSFFDGGGVQATEMLNNVMGDTCMVSLTRHLGTLTLCEWIDGWGWKGEAKYSVDTELGVRYVNLRGVTTKGNVNDRTRTDHIRGELMGWSEGAWEDAGKEMEEDRTVGVEESLEMRYSGGVAVMEESAKPQQGAFGLYGGYSAALITGVRVTPKPHQIYLMTPEYYIGHGNGSDGGESSTNWAGHWKNYCYPYFEYLGSNNDNRFEMAMHNFLAEVPNFFLRDGKLVSFSSKPEDEFKVMTAGRTYYMNVSMHQSENFTTVASPYSDINAIGRPSTIAFGNTGTSRLTMEGRYFGPAFQWKGVSEYKPNSENNTMERQMLRDPAQAPYVPPYLYGKQTARISFTPSVTKQFSVEEIFAGAKVENVSAETWARFTKCAQEDNGSLFYNPREILSSPAWTSRTTVSASMNLFGKSSIKQIEYTAQLSSLRDDLDESLQKFVPQTATDSSNDVWTIGTKWECPILNFYTAPALSALAMPALITNDGEFAPPNLPAMLSGSLQFGESGNGYVIKDSATEGENSGGGIWSSYGSIPSGATGVFVTVEESTISSATKDSQTNYGSLVDVCGFTTGKEKVGEISESKEISEAIVMIPFIDKTSETTAETVLVDGRHFFKINKTLFNMTKNNIEAGKPAVEAGKWAGVEYDVQETSISKMIRGMKKYNIPPKYDFVRYPMESSDNPFVMYIFEFTHKLNKHDLSDIWQGLPPRIALTAEHDSSTLLHDLSPIDFFEENTLPRHVRWMTFKIKKRAKENYYESTAQGADDARFEFKFESGKTPPKYSYNWPYDYFTMLEMIQVEAGVDIFENSIMQTPRTTSSQDEISSSETQRQITGVKLSSSQDIAGAPTQHSFGTDEDR